MDREDLGYIRLFVRWVLGGCNVKGILDCTLDGRYLLCGDVLTGRGLTSCHILSCYVVRCLRVFLEVLSLSCKNFVHIVVA